jgi:CoA:oxalate CoA-transferase
MTDERFATFKGRAENWATFMALLDDWAATRTTEECEAILTAGNVPCSRYFTVREALAHAHMEERGSFTTVDDGAGPLKVPNPSFKFERSAAHARDRVPALGADNAEILSRVLDYSHDRIVALYDQRVLHDDRKIT